MKQELGPVSLSFSCENSLSQCPFLVNDDNQLSSSSFISLCCRYSIYYFMILKNLEPMVSLIKKIRNNPQNKDLVTLPLKLKQQFLVISLSGAVAKSCTFGMWAILCHSSPSSFSHFFIKFVHDTMLKPSKLERFWMLVGKYVNFGQSLMTKRRRDVRFPIDSGSDLRFGK